MNGVRGRVGVKADHMPSAPASLSKLLGFITLEVVI
jgi:hypothetical protein